LEKVKSGICEIIELYTQRYEEEFQQLPTFFSTVLQLLSSTSQDPKYDVLASKALSFLNSVVRLHKHSNIYGTEGILKQLCEKIALPNMALRTIDEELFEDDPIEYIRRDLEGSGNKFAVSSTQITRMMLMLRYQIPTLVDELRQTLCVD
jgi:exportin-2 (importin alpha re-exporter)